MDDDDHQYLFPEAAPDTAWIAVWSQPDAGVDDALDLAERRTAFDHGHTSGDFEDAFQARFGDVPLSPLQRARRTAQLLIAPGRDARAEIDATLAACRSSGYRRGWVLSGPPNGSTRSAALLLCRTLADLGRRREANQVRRDYQLDRQ